MGHSGLRPQTALPWAGRLPACCKHQMEVEWSVRGSHDDCVLMQMVSCPKTLQSRRLQSVFHAPSSTHHQPITHGNKLTHATKCRRTNESGFAELDGDRCGAGNVWLCTLPQGLDQAGRSVQLYVASEVHAFENHAQWTRCLLDHLVIRLCRKRGRVGGGARGQRGRELASPFACSACWCRLGGVLRVQRQLTAIANVSDPPARPPRAPRRPLTHHDKWLDNTVVGKLGVCDGQSRARCVAVHLNKP
jgi:hypothetical protein